VSVTYIQNNEEGLSRKFIDKLQCIILFKVDTLAFLIVIQTTYCIHMRTNHSKLILLVNSYYIATYAWYLVFTLQGVCIYVCGTFTSYV